MIVHITVEENRGTHPIVPDENMSRTTFIQSYFTFDVRKGTVAEGLDTQLGLMC